MALWLGALSPLALFSYVASGHNEALMIGLLLAGVSLAVEGRLVPGLVLCALAATIKLPAAAAIVFLVVSRYREERGRARAALVAEAVVVPAATVAAVTLLSGFGWAWLGPSILRVPAELRVLATPAVSLGVFTYQVLHAVGVPLGRHATVTATQVVFGVAAIAGVVVLALKANRLNVVRVLGLALLLMVLGSPTVWPWYLMWGLSLLAVTTAQRSKVLAAFAAFAMLAVGPGGSPMLSGYAYLAVTAALALGLVWVVRERHWRAIAAGAVA
jgi:alpha-1,6-mannosyltransferase